MYKLGFYQNNVFSKRKGTTMKFKKIIISILILLITISINSISFGKYTFEHVEKIAEIKIIV